MKFYNPFKPHIVKYGDGTLMMRRLRNLAAFQWEFLDVDGSYWWSSSFRNKTRCGAKVSGPLLAALDKNNRIVKETKRLIKEFELANKVKVYEIL